MKSGWKSPTGAIQLPNCSSWDKPSLERRILLSSEEQQCLGSNAEEVRGKGSRDRGMQAGAVSVLVPHVELCSQAQAGILFPMPGGAGSPGGEHRPLEKDQEVNTSGHICALGPGHW